MLKRFLLIVLALVVGIVALLLTAIVALRPGERPPVNIDFTRYLTQLPATPTPITASFVGTPGPARLILTCAAPIIRIGVEVNGRQVIDPRGAVSCIDSLVREVPLAPSNTITISQPDTSAAGVQVRVKQRADVRLNVLSRVHFNTNVSDFATARAFYGKLGFETISGFPDTNTLAMARAIGIQTPTSYDGAKGGEAGGYLLHGELIGFGGFGGAIDLIEFTIPRDLSPPYKALNHLGMAKATLLTTEIDADHETLVAQGVGFLSRPVTRANGDRFAIFRDPDGTFYELRQPAQSPPSAAAEGRPTHLHAFGPLTVNASDFERSRAWYQMFGYQLTKALPAKASADEAKAMGFAQPFRIDGALLTHEVDGSTMELVQWLDPFDPERPYPLPVNHLGIHRTALATTDIEADVATLKAQGVEFVSPITPCCSGADSSGSIVAFFDPDGTVVELVEQPLLSWVMPALLRLQRMFE